MAHDHLLAFFQSAQDLRRYAVHDADFHHACFGAAVCFQHADARAAAGELGPRIAAARIRFAAAAGACPLRVRRALGVRRTLCVRGASCAGVALGVRGIRVASLAGAFATLAGSFLEAPSLRKKSWMKRRVMGERASWRMASCSSMRECSKVLQAPCVTTSTATMGAATVCFIHGNLFFREDFAFQRSSCGTGQICVE